MIHVVATIELKSGVREAFLAEFRKLVPLVRAEAGCIEYGPAVDVASGLPSQPPPRENVVVVIEKWSDLAAMTAHLNAPLLNGFREHMKDKLAGLTLQILEPA